MTEAICEPRRRRPHGRWDRLGRVLEDHGPLILLTSIYVGAGYAVGAATGLDVTRQTGAMSILMGLTVASVIVLLMSGSLLAVFLLSRSIRGMAGRSVPMGSRWADYRQRLSLERLGGVFVVFFLYVQLMNAFVGFKGEIPAIRPFVWDEAFMLLDYGLHYGNHPWVLAQGIVGTPDRTALIDGLYYVWFPVNLVFLMAMAWRAGDRLREQFFLTFFGLWVLLGTVMAIAFSSAGPCYYGRVVDGPDPYAPLMSYLRNVDRIHPLTALDVQALLWNGYAGRKQLIEGIAAMPSLHVAVPVLFAMTAWRIDRRVGAAFGVYALLVLVGSVHLAWHYAVDGYVVFLLVPVIWWATGRSLQALRR